MKTNNFENIGICKVCGKLENLLPNGMCILCTIKNEINSCSDVNYDLKEESDYIKECVPGYKNKELGTVSLGCGCFKKYTLYKE